MDNCLPYELSRFRPVTTENLDFYVSPYHSINEGEYQLASDAVDSLYRNLGLARERKKFQIFLCSNIEEMNILSNMTKYYGYVGGFANMEQKYAVYTYDTPVHKHEFVHLILDKPSGSSYILGEGMATLFGGISPFVSYAEGKRFLKKGYENSEYDFQRLYKREISNTRDNVPSYTTAAVVCEYIKREFGIKALLEMYHDPKINDDNLLQELAERENITKDRLVKRIESIIFEE